MELSLSSFSNEMDELNLLVEQIDSLGNTPDFLKIRAATSKSAILVSCGLFERFLKESFKEYIEKINSLKIPKKYVKHILWQRNRDNTLEVLKLINEGKIDAEYKRIVMDYSSSFNNDKKAHKPILIKESFSFTRSNPGEKTIKEMFENIGIKNVFKMPPLTIKFGDIRIVKSRLNSFVTLRHSFAHGLLGITIPSLTEVKDYLIFIRGLVCVFNEILNQELKLIEDQFYTHCFKSII